MKKIVISTFFCVGLLISGLSQKVTPPAPVYPVPSARQLAWHRLETYAFIHFTTNTFTDKEWGFGDEDPKIFNPATVDANQWASVLKQTGFKAMILTTKHHDGFALWPSKYTDHSVKNSPWKNGKGDVVKEASDAARKAGLKFGVYLSPWDRNRADYGTPSYITYYRNQLKELFTNYGPIFEMWFDGANGGDGYYGGTREKRKINGATYYNWPTTLKLVRSMQPDVLFFSDAGPDIRWVGNERGIAGETNWNSITPDTLYAGKAGIEKLLNTGSADGTKWISAEVDVSIRPGWFYHASEDSKVKTPEQLFDIYLSSVGRGSNLLLNIPPDRNGVFHPTDVASLEGFKKLLDERLTNNLAKQARVKASNIRGNAALYNGAKITDGNQNTYWATDDGVTAADVEVELPKVKKISYVLLQEYIALGQRVSAFSVEAQENGSWKEIATGTTIGYKRILRIDPVVTSKIRVRITGSKAAPLISNLALY
ncbi:alpha-L-fucosidase [Niabella pedocola]|uniref:alpha-L-fucosidase n=1 Tax=Niabella pedocola TaxID=1752077 RepID=A0ABS8PXY1_9BACT|nr:alpha-L-fucosidase [Niabella pedocola]MCD2425147.1 alpha-L-fucosidase [Niabella pedocola]